MKRFRARHLVAFDASGVAGASFSRGFSGLRARALAQAPLGEGALRPSPVEPNVRRPDEVREALREVARALDLGQAPVCLVLPDGLARVMALELPGDVEARSYARYRLSAGLPFPAEEAVIDLLPLGPKRVLAAAAHRAVLEGYEKVAAEAGLSQARVDLAPLGALAALGRPPAGERTVDVVLGDVALSMGARVDGVLRVVRNRRRDRGPGEAHRLREDAERTALLAGEGEPARLRVVGTGALAVLRDLVASGAPAEPGWRLTGDALPNQGVELAWLGAAL